MRFANISYFLKCVLVCFILLLLRFLVFSVPTTKNGQLSSSPSSKADDDELDRVPEFSFTRLIGNMSGSACDFEYNILVAIISAPGNVLLRRAIRSTFGSVLPVKFFVGKCREFTTGIKKTLCREKDVEKEAGTLKDIVRYDFIDAYNNLTLKTFSVLDFLTRCAPFVKLLVKIDDDTFVNPVRLREVLDEAHVFPSKDATERRKPLIFGHLQRGARPYRHRSSKYYISKDEYPPSQFPPFVSGPLYFMNRLAVDALHRTAVEFSSHLKKSPLHLEDVFFTGKLRSIDPSLTRSIKRVPNSLIFDSAYFFMRRK